MVFVHKWRIFVILLVTYTIFVPFYTNTKTVFGGSPLQAQCVLHALNGEKVAVSNSGELLLSVWSTGNARLWDVKSGKLLQSFHLEDDSEISSVSISEDNNYILLATNNFAPKGKVKKDVHITQWNVADGSLERTLNIIGKDGIFNYVKRVRFSPNQKYILAEDQATGIYIWDRQTGKVLDVIPTAADSNQYFEVSPNSKYLLIEGYRGYSVVVWDIETHRKLNNYETATEGQFSPDNTHLLTANFEGAILWDMTQHTQAQTFPEGGIWTFSPNGDVLMSTGNRVSIWQPNSGKLLHSFDRATNAFFFKSNKYLLVIEYVDENTSIYHVWDNTENKDNRQFTVSENAQDNFRIIASDTFVIVFDMGGQLYLRDLQTGEKLHDFC